MVNNFKTLICSTTLSASLVIGSSALAQSMGGWGGPMPPPPPGTVPAPTTDTRSTQNEESITTGVATALFPETYTTDLPALSRASTGDAAMPVVMFRAGSGVMFEENRHTAPLIDGTNSITIDQAQLDAEALQREWVASLLAATATATTSGLPHNVTVSRPREPRGPWTRIYQDSRRAVGRDLPEALADSLPWVDRDRKDETLDEVLNRVSGELLRAREHDPEWALAAERELRALDARLDRMPEPPAAAGGVVEMDRAGTTMTSTVTIDPRTVRPFRPRPVWPGAVATAEPQVRPTTLTTHGIEDTGPTSSGVVATWTPPVDHEAAPNPASEPRSARRADRRN
jgi:hypothetical protein